jgi:thiamine pyrophosphate-dependent acetolactate synthase large subunit-like protein
MGDASIGMTGMDIETAARNRIAILTIVFNNGVMAAERDVLELSTKKYGALTIGGNYTKVAEGLNVAAMRIAKPGDIVPAIKDAVRVTETGAPFLLEILVKEGYDFSRYPLTGLQLKSAVRTGRAASPRARGEVPSRGSGTSKLRLLRRGGR